MPANEKLVVIRLDRDLRVDPVLGDLQGKMITMVPRAPGTLAIGQRAVFFTNSWVHGRGIAVREVEHSDVADEDSVATTVLQLPEAHSLERLQSAELVADAQVVRITTVERTSFERNAALWNQDPTPPFTASFMGNVQADVGVALARGSTILPQAPPVTFER